MGLGGGFSYCSIFPRKIHLHSNQVDISTLSLCICRKSPLITLQYPKLDYTIIQETLPQNFPDTEIFPPIPHVFSWIGKDIKSNWFLVHGETCTYTPHSTPTTPIHMPNSYLSQRSLMSICSRYEALVLFTSCFNAGETFMGIPNI